MEKTKEVIEQEHYFTARAVLASRLIAAGVPGDRTVNPYDTNRAAWLFDLTPQAREIIDQYFTEKGKPSREGAR